MEIALSADNMKFIENQVAAGIYKSFDDAVNAFVSKFVISEERINALNVDIQKGLDDYDAGRYSDADEFFQELIAEYEQV